MQSPTSDLMASGYAGMVPAFVAAMFWLSTKISPFGSTAGGIFVPLAPCPPFVSWMGTLMAVML